MSLGLARHRVIAPCVSRDMSRLKSIELCCSTSGPRFGCMPSHGQFLRAVPQGGQAGRLNFRGLGCLLGFCFWAHGGCSAHGSDTISTIDQLADPRTRGVVALLRTCLAAFQIASLLTPHRLACILCNRSIPSRHFVQRPRLLCLLVATALVIPGSWSIW